MISSRVLTSIMSTYALMIVLVAPRVTHADAVNQQPTAEVRFGDLSLDSRSSVEILFHRIQTAADEVCKQYQSHGTLLPSPAHRTCVKNAVGGAVRDIDSPALTAYYAGITSLPGTRGIVRAVP